MDNQKGSELVIGDVVSAALSLGEMSAQPGKAQPAYDDSEVSSVSAPAPRETPAAQCPGPPAHASSTVPDLHPLTPGQLEQRTLDSLASVSLPGSPPNIPGNASCSPHPSSASSLSPQGTGVDSHLLLSTTDSTERPLPLGDTGPVGTSPASPGTLHPDATSHSPLVPGASSSRPHVPKAASPSPTPEAASLGLRDASHAPLQASASPLNPGAALPVLISCLPTSSSPLPPGPNSPSSLPTSPSSLPGAVSPSLDSPGSSSRLQSHPSSDLSASEGPEEKVGRDRGPSQSGQPVYHIKWLQWKEQPTPIITQNENGPCPLLAIINVLLLAWKVKLPPMMEIITSEQLMEYLGDYILETKPKEISEVQRLNYEQNMNDAMAVLHKLQTGLDVNVKFTGIQVFEYTPECIVFDLLNIPLYHGWLVDPQVADVVNAVGNCSYNQLVEKVILCKQSDNSELVSQGIVAEQFLYATATQLTYHGLCELTSSVAEGELCVFFRNNHFSTMTKNKVNAALPVRFTGPGHDILPGSWILVKAYERSSCLAFRWRGPYQVLLVTRTAVRVAGKKNWVHATHVKKIPHPTPHATEDTEPLAGATISDLGVAGSVESASEKFSEPEELGEPSILSPHSLDQSLPENLVSSSATSVATDTTLPSGSDDTLLLDSTNLGTIRYNLRPRKWNYRTSVVHLEGKE
ncbi:ubiquitin carboxyl-terminal hydrolase MINDY-2 isoform X1 [Ambystoma mexicanum]|uniref:ubiquitin carboxyl-terminal hydrolase MINDY-2 isoform X1 n=1 Tax=Ambystoma mexicanum TaxID=8296 RepID=UPI0037E711C0